MRNNSSSNPTRSDKDASPVGQFTKTLQETYQQTQHKYNNDESILETFIQWMTKPDKTKLDQSKQKDKPEKGKKKLNFLKRNRTDTNNPSTSEELRVLNERLSRLESNPFFQNVHLSRPSTPKPIPSTSQPEAITEPIYDKYRVMYLLVRVEQQLEHMRKVVQTMQENGAKRSRVRSVSKVMRQLESQHKQLLRILANDATTLAQIGDADDLELFFQNIDSICSATQEISLYGDGGPLCNPDVIITKDGKVKTKKTESSTGDLRSVFGCDVSDQDQQVPDVSKTRNTKEYLEKYRQKYSKEDMRDERSGNGDRQMLMYKSGTVESWSDTDTDEEMLVVEKGEGQKYKWPILNTSDEKRLEKEKKLHTLMTEIDDLMQDVGLTDGKSKKKGITYEVLMMGSGEMTKKSAQTEAPKKKYKQFDTDPDRFKGAKSKNPASLREANSVKKSKSQSDKFVEEFDRLLNECDSKK